MRNQDSVAVVNWPERRLVWAWGRGELSGPHDATLLENGHILIFDNGLVERRSRVVEVDPLRNEIVWLYEAPEPGEFFTPGRGSSQRLPNGNTLIAESADGRAFEVTPSGEIVWEYFVPILNREGYRATIVRIRRYDTAAVERLLSADRSSGAPPTATGSR
jgi:hypothetical protein